MQLSWENSQGTGCLSDRWTEVRWFAEHWQTVLFPFDVLETRKGNITFSVFFCSSIHDVDMYHNVDASALFVQRDISMRTIVVPRARLWQGHMLLRRTSWWPAQHLPHLKWKARKERRFSSTILLLMLCWSYRKNLGCFRNIVFFLSCQYSKVRDTQTKKGPGRSYSLA